MLELKVLLAAIVSQRSTSSKYCVSWLSPILELAIGLSSKSQSSSYGVCAERDVAPEFFPQSTNVLDCWAAVVLDTVSGRSRALRWSSSITWCEGIAEFICCPSLGKVP